MIRDVSFAFHIPTASLLKLFSILPRTICNHFSHTPDNLLKPFPTPCENYFLLYKAVPDVFDRVARFRIAVHCETGIDLRTIESCIRNPL